MHRSSVWKFLFQGLLTKKVLLLHVSATCNPKALLRGTNVTSSENRALRENRAVVATSPTEDDRRGRLWGLHGDWDPNMVRRPETVGNPMALIAEPSNLLPSDLQPPCVAVVHELAQSDLEGRSHSSSI